MSHATPAPVEAHAAVAVARPGARDLRRRLGDYAVLTKARLSMLVLWTTVVGFVLAAEQTGTFDGWRLLATLVGTGLAAGAANAFNQIMEIHRDVRMRRTRERPLPAGNISPAHATVAAFAMLITGAGVLILGVNAAAAWLALLTVAIYVALYTPLKTRSTLNTLVGAVCGAIPPLIGWVAVTGHVDRGAWALAGILFIWQIPHFLALAWLYRADYERGGYVMLPILDASGRLTSRVVVLTSLMLVPLALTVTLAGLAGWLYAVGSVLLGGLMVVAGVRLWRGRTDADARRVFLASLLYLSTLLLLLVLDRGPVGAGPEVHRVVANAALTP